MVSEVSTGRRFLSPAFFLPLFLPDHQEIIFAACVETNEYNTRFNWTVWGSCLVNLLFCPSLAGIHTHLFHTYRKIAWNRWVSYFDLVRISRLKPARLRMRTAAAFSFEEGYEQWNGDGPFLWSAPVQSSRKMRRLLRILVGGKRRKGEERRLSEPGFLPFFFLSSSSLFLFGLWKTAWRNLRNEAYHLTALSWQMMQRTRRALFSPAPLQRPTSLLLPIHLIVRCSAMQ